MNIHNCPLCASASFKSLFQAREYVFSSQEKFQLVECNHCGLVFLNPQPSQDQLQQFYPPELFVDQVDSFRAHSPSFMLLNKTKEAAHFNNKGILLDVGCGPGYFLQQMKNRGWQVNGLDVSSAACKIAGQRVGEENIFQGDLSSVDIASDKYDMVTLWHVIEHLHNPKETLLKIRYILKDDGTLIVCCPNFGSWLRVIFKEYWFPLVVPHHLLHFTPKTLKLMLEASGFKVRYQKRHFIDPFLNFGSLKESLLRLFGFGNLTTMLPAPSPQGGSHASERNTAWKISRTLFNLGCIIVSLILGVLGNEESILIWAQKDKDA